MSSPSYRKKLIEVALPLAAINSESAREKSIRHGHPSTLHLWWARRPLAACRAVLFSSLVDDPDSDPQYLKADGTVDEEAAGIKRADLFNLIEELVMWENSNNVEVIRTARAEIARCVASRLIETGVLKKEAVIGGKTTAYHLVTRGHCRPLPIGLDTKVGRVRFKFDVSGLPPAEDVNQFLAEHAPPVLDPFAGGGSIPLEAQRLGLRAYASDLNPVPVLINKALIEIPPKFAGRPPVNPDSRAGLGEAKGKGKKSKKILEHDWPGATGLAEDVRYYGKWMRDEAEKRIGHLYPKIEVTADMTKDRPDLVPYLGQKLTVIAWLWARTVASPDPICQGKHVPLVRSFVLSTKSGKNAFVEPEVDRKNMSYWFEIRLNKATAHFDPSCGTKEARGASFRCVLSGTPIAKDYIRDEFKRKRNGTALMAIVAEGTRGRIYLPPLPEHESLARTAVPVWRPELEMNSECKDLVSGRGYGISSWHEIFTDRQLLALTTFCSLVGDARERSLLDTTRSHEANNNLQFKPSEYADAIATYLGLAVSKLADALNSLARWKPSMDQAIAAFGRQALPMVWDFAESNTFNGNAGDYATTLATMVRAVANLPNGTTGTVKQLNATEALPNCEQPMCSTDPPYYDNISYADLSDFFYLWLRRALSSVHPSLFATVLTPKAQELIAAAHRHEGNRSQAQAFFEDGLEKAFKHIRGAHNSNCPFTVYYAFKQSETDDDEASSDSSSSTLTTASTGWETMLAGLIRSGFAISGTWPMRTEMGNRMVGIGTNALASSIVLVCRPRPENAALATRKELITTLRRELPDALRNLQRGNIAPVDLAQAAIGPGMAVFTRYSKVLESDGSPMTVRTALGLINQSLDEVLAEQEGEFDGDTRWALAWFDQFGMDEGPYGDAETLSKAKNTAINGLVEAGIVLARGGKVRLVKRDELPGDWNPATDKRLTVWEVTQHLIHRLDQQGEVGAAELVGQLGGIAEVSRDLAYRLYSTCERKKWAQEALAYNSLVVAWPELTKLARTANLPKTGERRRDLDFGE